MTRISDEKLSKLCNEEWFHQGATVDIAFDLRDSRAEVATLKDELTLAMRGLKDITEARDRAEEQLAAARADLVAIQTWRAGAERVIDGLTDGIGAERTAREKAEAERDVALAMLVDVGGSVVEHDARVAHQAIEEAIRIDTDGKHATILRERDARIRREALEQAARYVRGSGIFGSYEWARVEDLVAGLKRMAAASLTPEPPQEKP